MDVNETYCGDRFAIDTNPESSCTPETNVMLYVNYVSILKNANLKFFEYFPEMLGKTLNFI